jgi:hypothetical protein
VVISAGQGASADYKGARHTFIQSKYKMGRIITEVLKEEYDIDKISIVLRPITLVKIDIMDNWYTIERRDHKNETYFTEVSGNHISLHYSGRICDADVEGYGAEMIDIARAIKSNKDAIHRRCAVMHDPLSDKFFFWSPRNSCIAAQVHSEDANQLANEILETLT